MNNITGMITVLIGAVAAGVSVWFISKQYHRKEVYKRSQETERRLLAQLEQERHQRQEIERQRKHEQEQSEETQRRLLAQLGQERHQRQEIERQRKHEQEQYQETERHLLTQLKQETDQRQEIERQRKQEQDQREETEHHLLTQLKQERHQRQEIERQLKQGETEDSQATLDRIKQLKDSNQSPNQKTTVPETKLPSSQRLKGEIEGGIGELANSQVNFFVECATPSPKITPSFASNLRELLTSGEWEKADEETLKIMLKVTGREKEGWLDVASIQNLLCEDLRTIDQLWLESSKGRFGLSVQKRIWQSVGGTLNADDKIYEAFGDRIGWRDNKNWLQIDDLTFKPSALVGHLPATAVRLGGLSWGVDGFWWEKRKAYVYLLSQKDW